MATGSAFGFSGYDPIMSMAEGYVNDYFGRRSEKRAFERQLQLMESQYNYAQRYAENSPSWNVTGLRAAGLNPILAVSNGANLGSSVPSVPSVTSHKADTGSNTRTVYDPLTYTQYRLAREDLKIKEDTRKTLAAENEVKRLKAEAEAGLLRPWTSEPLEGDGKSISVQLPSKSFKALQKAIADDYDLRSEKYMRETIDAIMKYGTDVLKLLPAFRRKEIFDTIQKTTKTDPKGKKTVTETLTTHSPR